MWNWNQFKNLPRNRDLSPQEQSRQYFIYQSNMMYEASLNNSVAAAAAAAAGSGGGSGLTNIKTDFLIFGVKEQPTLPPDDYMLFRLNNNDTTDEFETSDIFYGPTVFANNTDDGFKYFVTRDLYDFSNPILLGKMDNSGVVTYISESILEQLGGSIDNLVGSISFNDVSGIDDTYIGLTGSTNGTGYMARFDVIVSGGTVSSVLVNSPGDLYKINDTISISADKFGGSASQNLIITVDNIKSPSSPTSLYYEGDGSFIYLDKLLFIDNNDIMNKVVRINTNGTASLVSMNSQDNGLYPTSLFEYDGDIWAGSIPNYPIALIGKYDITTGLFDEESANEITVNNIPNVTMTKVWFVMSVINVDGKIYCNLVVNNKEIDETIQCICELNMETFEAEYLYSIPSNTEYLHLNIIDL
jgi:hypothetical protein